MVPREGEDDAINPTVLTIRTYGKMTSMTVVMDSNFDRFLHSSCCAAALFGFLLSEMTFRVDVKTVFAEQICSSLLATWQ